MLQRLILAFILISPSFAFSTTLHALTLSQYTPKEGDMVFQSFPHNELTDVIETASGSELSHCGIVISKATQPRKAAQWYVLEAVGPVKETPLKEWIERGRGHAITVYRLRESYRAEIPKIIKAAQSFTGKPYDIKYEFDDQKIYCSELLFKAYRNVTKEDLGTVKKLGDLNWKPIEPFIRRIENGKLPLDREMITPYELSQAKQLALVGRYVE